MLRIDRIDQKLHKLNKPKIEIFHNVVVDTDDFLVMCAGFEDRSLETLKRIVSNGCVNFNVLLINYLPELQENKTAGILDLCEKAKARVYELVYDRERPEGFGDKIVDVLRSHTGKIFFDISAMSRLLIVQILVAVGKSEIRFSDSSILYAEAEQYPPNEEEVNLKLENSDTLNTTIFLSSGVFEVMILPELSSVAMQGQPIRLIAFPSFNEDQLAALRSEIQPSFYNLIHGIPLYEKNAWRPNAIKKLNQIEDINITLRTEKELSTLDYRATLEYLLEVYDDRGVTDRIMISPIGSKMQAVAVGIFRTFMDDVQIVYPTPCEFVPPSSYTVGVKDTYLLPLRTFAV